MEGNEKEEIFRSIKIPKADVSSFRSVQTVGDYHFLEVTPADIRGSFGFNTKIGTSISISKELDKQVKLQLYSIFAAEPLVKRDKLVIDVLKSHEHDPEEYMTTGQQVDTGKSIALAEEHNRQLLAGEPTQIIPELITPEHIQIHDAFIQSGKLSRQVKQAAQKHVLDEIRVSKTQGIGPSGTNQPGMDGAQQGMSFPAVERTPGLTQPLSNQPGLSKNVVLPGSAAEVGPAVMRPTLKPK